MHAISLLIFYQIRSSLIKIATDPRKLIPTLIVLGIYSFLNLQRIPVSFPIIPVSDPHDLKALIRGVDAFVIFILAFVSLSCISQGFQCVYLGFSVPDIDYLMSSPISRRVVLALKVLKVNLSGLALAVIFWTVFKTFVPIFFPKGHDGFSLGELSVFCSLAGIQNIGMAISAHIGKRRDGFLAAQLSALALFIAAFGTVIFRGIGPASRLLTNNIFTTLFFWCHWAADAMVVPLTGRSGLIPALELAGFYVASLGLVFFRSANFYEAAFFVTHDMEQMREARVKTSGVGESALIYARQYDQKVQRDKNPSPYTLPPFGPGALAILWANLCCAWKRPWNNFAFPVAVGIIIGGINIWEPDAVDLPVIVLFLCYFSIIAGGVFAFLPALIRRPLVGPLPVAPWKMAAADILPFAFCCYLPLFTLAMTLWIGRVAVLEPIIVMCLTVGPIIVAGLCAVPYIALTAFSSSAQDAVQQGLSLGIFLVAVPFVAALYAPLLLAPAAANFSVSWGCIVALPGCVGLTVLLLRVAGTSYANLGSEGDRKSFRESLLALMSMPRRMPTIDEGLWLGVLVLAVSVYDGAWLERYGLLIVIFGNETWYFGLAMVFAWIGRYDFRQVFSFNPPSAGQLLGGLLLGAGSLPWVMLLNVAAVRLWHPDFSASNSILHAMAIQLAVHPVFAPLIMGALAGVCEEIVFRGPIQTALVRRIGPNWGILTCGFIFAAWHLDYFGLAFRTALGVMLGWIVWRGKSIFPAMLAHFVIDTSVFGYYSYIVHARGINSLHVGSATELHFTYVSWLILAGSALALVLGWWLIEKSGSTGTLTHNSRY